MYRQYENTFELEERLNALLIEYREAIMNNADDVVLIDLSYDIDELKQRVNFAWQDDEYDEHY